MKCVQIRRTPACVHPPLLTPGENQFPLERNNRLVTMNNTGFRRKDQLLSKFARAKKSPPILNVPFLHTPPPPVSKNRKKNFYHV